MKMGIVGAVLTLSLSSAIASADLYDTQQPGDPIRLINISDRVNQLVRTSAHQLDRSRIIEVERKLVEIKRLIAGDYPPPVPPGYSLYEAQCDVDDDSKFDWNQHDAGRVQASSVPALIQECADRARAIYGSFSSSGIRDLRVVGSTSPYARSAVCWIDDDPKFDHGQILIGQLTGSSINELSDLCRTIANSIYGYNGSSGLTDIR